MILINARKAARNARACLIARNIRILEAQWTKSFPVFERSAQWAAPKLLQLVEEGMPRRKTAKRFGISLSTVARIIRRAGIDTTQHAQCTCNLKPWPDGPDWNPHCPKHGLDALAQGTASTPYSPKQIRS